MKFARRTQLRLIYENKDITADLKPYLKGFSYTDYASGRADDLQISLQDKDGLWKSDWFPDKGAWLQGWIEAEGRRLPIGSFTIDEIECAGPPETVTIKAVSVPTRSSIWDECKNRAWEETSLIIVAADIAGAAGIQLFYESDYVPKYDRLEQTEETDLAMLLRLCQDAGLLLKVSGKQLIIFDDGKYEQMPPVKTITRSMCLSYQAVSQTRDVYAAARVEYSGTDGDIGYTFTPSNGPDTGKTLVINERVTSIAEAEVLARNRLRQKNKEEVRLTIAMPGDPDMAAGVTLMVRGWGVFDGKYFIDVARHEVSNGYTTSLELRRVLEGY